MNRLKLLLILCLVYSSVVAQTQIICHRGYWDCEGSAQNSITALNKAHEIGAYGSEFDVLLTLDGLPVVNHDNSINGLVIEDTNYEKLKDIKLKNGETLPTLENYLQVGKTLIPMQLILEIKPHKSVEAEDRAVLKIVELVRRYKLEDRVEYISFSLHICKKLKEVAPNSSIAYLNGNIAPKELDEIGLSGLDYNFKILKNNPHWITEAVKLGLTVNSWTINKKEDMEWLIDRKVDYITTDKPLELKGVMENYNR